MMRTFIIAFIFTFGVVSSSACQMTQFNIETVHRLLRGASRKPQRCLDLGMKVVSRWRCSVPNRADGPDLPPPHIPKVGANFLQPSLRKRFRCQSYSLPPAYLFPWPPYSRQNRIV